MHEFREHWLFLILFFCVPSFALCLKGLTEIYLLACEQGLLFRQAKWASRERASEGPSRLRRSLARSRETRFTRPNRRACSQAIELLIMATLISTQLLKELYLEIYQNSNRGNCQQIGWNIKIYANTAKTEGSMDGQTRRTFKQIAFVFWKLVRLTVWQRFFVVVCNDWYNACETYFVWHKAVILSLAGCFSSKDA